VCRSNARGRKRETRFDFGDDVCYVVCYVVLRRTRETQGCVSNSIWLCFFYVRSPFLLLLNSYLCLSVVIRFDVVVRTGRFLIHK